MEIAASKNYINIKSPFLSKEIIEYSFKIPHNYKYHKKNKKYILKEVLYSYIPKQLIEQKKMGFGSPIRNWIKDDLYDDIKRVSSKTFIEKQKIFNYNAVQRLIRHTSNPNIIQIIWNYYVFQIWYETYM